MRLVHILSAVLAELRAVLRVAPHLRRTFWVVWTGVLLVALVGLLPGGWAVYAQAVALAVIGVGAFLSGMLAKRVRRRNWVEFPDGPEVAPYLPQLLTLLLLPPFLLAELVLFRRVGLEFPGWLPVGDWLDAALLTADNLVRTQIFFDAAESFQVRFGGKPTGPAGTTLVFVTRLMLDAVFVKLAVQLLSAAYFRSLGLGRGEDKLFAVKQAVEAGDTAAVKFLCQDVGDSLRDAVDSLRGTYEAGGRKAGTAWRCLVAMRDYAVPYLEGRHAAATGEERERLARLIDRLKEATDIPPLPVARPWRLRAAAAVLVAAVAAAFLVPGEYAPGVVVPLTVLVSWMLVGPRRWLDRLVRWRMLPPATPNLQSRRQLRWALALLPLVLACWVRLFHLTAPLTPGVFVGAPGAVDYPSAAAFVFDNILRTQVFADAFELYGVRVTDLSHAGGLGGLLVFLLRLTLNLGLIAVLVSFVVVWFNRVYHRFAVSRNAELKLRREAAGCGPQAPEQVGYHLAEIRAFFAGQGARTPDREMLVALAPAGFLGAARAAVAGDDTVEAAVERRRLAGALFDQGRFAEAEAEYRAALGIYDRLTVAGKPVPLDGTAWVRRGLGIALRRQGRFAEAEAEYRQALGRYTELLRAGHHQYFPEMASVRESLGIFFREQGRLADAEFEIQSVVNSVELVLQEGLKEYRPRLARARVILAEIVMTRGRIDDAVAEYRRAVNEYEQLSREGGDVRQGLTRARAGLADGLFARGRPAEAEAERRKALEEYELLAREGNTEILDQLARERMNLAIDLRNQKKFAEAEGEHRKAVELYERLIREGRSDLREEAARTRGNLANVLCDLKRLDEAEAEHRKAVELYERLIREGRAPLRHGLAITRMNLGDTLAKQGRAADAMAEYRSADELLVRLVREGKSQHIKLLAECWHDALSVALKFGPDHALPVLESAVGILRELQPRMSELPAEARAEIEKFFALARSSGVISDLKDFAAKLQAPPPA